MVVCFLTDNNATVLAEDKQRVYESRSFILGNTVLGSKSQNTSPQHSLIADHGFKVSPRKSPESPSSERSLVFSVTAPSPQSSPSSGRLTPTNLGAGAINYSSHSINLSPYSSPGVSNSSCFKMTQL